MLTREAAKVLGQFEYPLWKIHSGSTGHCTATQATELLETP